jgi:shikimate dehydrogenase
MSNRYAVLGSPIGHSKSPAIHLAAYRVLGLDWEYGRADVPKGSLRKFVHDLDQPVDGLSVTMPLKEEATKFASVLDESARLTGATNTLAKQEDGTWLGFNTDVFGIVKAVEESLTSAPKKTVIIGSGATAYSAVVAVARIAPNSCLKISARNRKTRKELVHFARQQGLKASRVYSFVNAVGNAELTISTVPAHALDEQASRLMEVATWTPGGVLLDVAYDPWPSKAAELWAKREKPVVSGIEMLIWQAVAQIRIFRFGSPANELPNEVAVVAAMRHAVGL